MGISQRKPSINFPNSPDFAMAFQSDVSALNISSRNRNTIIQDMGDQSVLCHCGHVAPTHLCFVCYTCWRVLCTCAACTTLFEYDAIPGLCSICLLVQMPPPHRFSCSTCYTCPSCEEIISYAPGCLGLHCPSCGWDTECNPALRGLTSSELQCECCAEHSYCLPYLYFTSPARHAPLQPNSLPTAIRMAMNAHLP